MYEHKVTCAHMIIVFAIIYFQINIDKGVFDMV